MKFQISQMTRFTRLTGHRKMFVTLGAGAIALTAVACGSAAATDDPLPGDPPPESPPAGQNDGDFALGAPNGIELSGGAQPTSGGTAEGMPGAAIIAPGLPVDPRYACESGSSDPSVLFVEGEPVSVPPSPETVIYDLPVTGDSFSLGMPAPGYENSGVVEMIVVDPAVEPVPEVRDGIALGMPVPELAYPTEMIVEALEAPDPVSAPPANLPTPEGTSPKPVNIAENECDSGTVSTSNSGTTIEPMPVPDLLPVDDPVRDIGDELPVNIMVVEAPIESAGISVAESFPPQYMLWVVSGLSNGATTFGEYAVKRDGNVVAVSITNYVQTDVMATQLYGIHRSNIALGSEFAPGEEYEVVINGRLWTKFTTQ